MDFGYHLHNSQTPLRFGPAYFVAGENPPVSSKFGLLYCVAVVESLLQVTPESCMTYHNPFAGRGDNLMLSHHRVQCILHGVSQGLPVR